MARGGYRANNGFSQNARKTTDDMTKRSMNITKNEEIDKKFEDKLIDWCTFYRRNIHRFAEHYLGIRLHFYQKIMLYLMNLCPQVVILCSRAMGNDLPTLNSAQIGET